jgi:antitoxin (DNA-binding transcriptional repressor) of toxin-antitoxin stability system
MTVHITEAELARDPRSALEQVRQGNEVVIEQDREAVAVIRPAQPQAVTISEAVARARQREQERGHAVVLDPDFAEDVAEVVRNREPWNPPSWE